MCPPCRLGLQKLAQLLKSAAAGTALPEEKAELKELAGYIAESSRCAMGGAAVQPMRSALKYFPEAFR